MARLSHPMTPVSFERVRIDDAFWSPRQRVNRERTIPQIYQQLMKTGRIAALGGEWSEELRQRGTRGDIVHLFYDSDVAKWLEAASYSLALNPDPALSDLVDDLIARLAAAQQPDGYLNSWFTAVEPEKRWANLRDWHELYDAGHLIEAGVAHFQATGSRSLLDVVARYADYIDSVFGRESGKRRGYCGHPEIELALVRLYHVTGAERYLNLARYMIDERGQAPHYFDLEARARGDDPANFWARTHQYSQSHCPVRVQDEVVGHAVRATYLYSAMADLAAEDGDATLLTACQKLFRHLTTKRMYVMGGIGSSMRNEGFTSDYDLPNESAYAETCAAIALIFWAQRMLRVDLDSRYADILELALYNAVLSGVSADGEHYFYANPLASAGDTHRPEWYPCPCCPPNLARLIASLGGYLYSQTETEAVVHLYVQSETTLQLGGKPVTLRQKTQYPWQGDVTLTVNVAGQATFDLSLRLPGWCAAPRVTCNGAPVDLAVSATSGYVRLSRTWDDGDVIVLELPMPVERVFAHPEIQADLGAVALRRGPIVYAFEQIDQSAPLHRLALPVDAALHARFEPDVLGGLTMVEAVGSALSLDDWDVTLYRSTPRPAVVPCLIRAVPYFAWDNREPGPMRVWIRELAHPGHALES